MSAVLTDSPIIELEDSWEAVNDWFLKNDLTDGLPIVPPTQPRVSKMVEYVERTLGWTASDVIGALAPKQGQATVEKIAANAVMAGCRPEYMPVLIACVQAISDPKFSALTNRNLCKTSVAVIARSAETKQSRGSPRSPRHTVPRDDSSAEVSSN